MTRLPRPFAIELVDGISGNGIGLIDRLEGVMRQEVPLEVAPRAHDVAELRGVFGPLGSMVERAGGSRP
jgi:hypothetical protein